MMNVDDGCFDNEDAAKAYLTKEDKMSEKKTVYLIGKKGNLCEGVGDCDDSVAEKCADRGWCDTAGLELSHNCSLFDHNEAVKWAARIIDIAKNSDPRIVAGHVEMALMSAFEKGIIIGKCGHLLARDYAEIIEFGKHIHENNGVDDTCRRCGHDLRHVIHSRQL